MQPGETIDDVNSSVRVTGYTAIGGAFYATDIGDGNFAFTSGSFYGTFGFTVNQGSNTNPVDTLQISGSIRTSSGRTIPIDIQDQYTVSSSRSSSNNSCTIYIPAVNKNWRLVNDNATTSIRWQALLSSGGTIIGGILAPGNTVSSAFYGGTYTCIKENSLTYGSGGTPTYSAC